MDFKRRSEAANELHKRFADEDYEQNRKDFKSLLQLPEFRRVFANIIKRARVFGSVSFETVETNAVMKAIGFRELGVDIYMTANQADGEMVLRAISERNDIERNRKQMFDRLFDKETKGNA